MKLTISKRDLIDFLVFQIKNIIPDKKRIFKKEIERHMDDILQRTEYCFSKVNNHYFKDGDNVTFNHLHGDQYAMFLYFASNTLYKNNSDITLCTKIFQLNKYLHGIDVYYEVELPEIFLFVHPIGTVLGRASYSDYLLVYQGCNIGSDHGIFPTLGKHFSIHPGASILGKCKIEDNCKISTGSLIMNKNLKKDSVYIGNTLNFVIKKSVNKLPIWL